jgi:hypothetical protein
VFVGENPVAGMGTLKIAARDELGDHQALVVPYLVQQLAELQALRGGEPAAKLVAEPEVHRVGALHWRGGTGADAHVQAAMTMAVMVKVAAA